MIDNKKRTFVKACSWRLFAIFLLGTVAYISIGNLKTVTLITLMYHTIQTFMFIVHERIWARVKWGKTKGLFIQLSGMSGAGKTTIANGVALKLKKKNLLVEIIDGDEYRKNISKTLSFSKKDREENINRLGFIGKVLSRNNVISIMATINPYEASRDKLIKDGAKTVYIKCSLNELKRRDTKGFYKRAVLNDDDPEKINNFTGISDPFEEPYNADLVIDTEKEDVNTSIDKLYNFILSNLG